MVRFSTSISTSGFAAATLSGDEPYSPALRSRRFVVGTLFRFDLPELLAVVVRDLANSLVGSQSLDMPSFRARSGGVALQRTTASDDPLRPVPPEPVGFRDGSAPLGCSLLRGKLANVVFINCMH